MVFDPEKSPSLPNNELLEETVVKSDRDWEKTIGVTVI